MHEAALRQRTADGHLSDRERQVQRARLESPQSGQRHLQSAVDHSGMEEEIAAALRQRHGSERFVRRRGDGVDGTVGRPELEAVAAQSVVERSPIHRRSHALTNCIDIKLCGLRRLAGQCTPLRTPQGRAARLQAVDCERQVVGHFDPQAQLAASRKRRLQPHQIPQLRHAPAARRLHRRAGDVDHRRRRQDDLSPHDVIAKKRLIDRERPLDPPALRALRSALCLSGNPESFAGEGIAGHADARGMALSRQLRPGNVHAARPELRQPFEVSAGHHIGHERTSGRVLQHRCPAAVGSRVPSAQLFVANVSAEIAQFLRQLVDARGREGEALFHGGAPHLQRQGDIGEAHRRVPLDELQQRRGLIVQALGIACGEHDQLPTRARRRLLWWNRRGFQNHVSVRATESERAHPRPSRRVSVLPRPVLRSQEERAARQVDVGILFGEVKIGGDDAPLHRQDHLHDRG